MSKINSIRINNFKFFRELEPIVLNGKNLLLYGENGSGKSSIYNALYTVLEAASKEPTDVQKYFFYPSEQHPESLVNIYAEHNEDGIADSYIEIEEDNGKHYQLAYNHTEICGNPSFVESQRTTDFINYKSLFSFQLFRNSESSDLHDVFEYTVIPYLSCPAFPYQGKILGTLSDLFKAYADIDSIKEPNKKGKLVIYKKSKSKLYENFEDLERAINNTLTKLIEYINSQLVNEKDPEDGLLYKLKCPFKAKLVYEPISHTKTDTKIFPNPYKVLLEIPEYEGKEVCIKRPNVFLNEAKMSALAFAIRWAILTKRPDEENAPDALRVLVLDDLMISLDMGNREKVLKFLFAEERANAYQILFLTHERPLFDMMMLKLQQKYNLNDKISVEDEWCIMEMYDQEVDGQHFPMVQPYQSAYARALAYLNGGNGWRIDYSACGNALRQALEEEFKRIFRLIGAKNKGGGKIDYDKLMIGDCVDIALYNFPLHHFSLDVVNSIQSITKFSLNSLSHDNPSMNFYKEELEEAIEAYKRLRSIQKVLLLPTESVVTFDVECESGLKNHYYVQFKEDVYAYLDSVNLCWDVLDQVDVMVWMEGTTKLHSREKESLMEIYQSTVDYLKGSSKEPIDKSGDLWNEVQYNGQPLSSMLDREARRICKDLSLKPIEKKKEGMPSAEETQAR